LSSGPNFLVSRIPTGYCYLECKHGLGEVFHIAILDRTLHSTDYGYTL
jgi:hypothetical protein